MKILIHNLNIRHKPGKTAYHCHDFWQIDYYFHTETRVKTRLDGDRDYLDDTRFALIPPHCMHEFNVVSPCRISTLKFVPGSGFNAADFKGAVLEIADFESVAEAIFSSSAAEDEFELEIRKRYLEILLLCVRRRMRYGSPTRKKIIDQRLSEAICRMQRTAADGNGVNLEQLAGTANMSVNHFIRCFKREFGMTPMRYARKLSIRKAVELLTYSDMSLTEIGDRLGFPDQHCFSRTFRRENGMPPGTYRKLQREPK